MDLCGCGKRVCVDCVGCEERERYRLCGCRDGGVNFRGMSRRADRMYVERSIWMKHGEGHAVDFVGDEEV